VTRSVALVAALVLLLGGCAKSTSNAGGPRNSLTGTSFAVTSTAFNPDGPLPVQFSCDGDGVSPPLAWSGIPKSTTSLTLTVTDPDARGFVHWRVKDIPPHDGKIEQGEAPAGGTTVQPWRAACPPKGAGLHHYVFRVEAAPSGSTGALTATFQR
jgi:Raf kinase inhibitor-like YbhB/YbcL family protein